MLCPLPLPGWELRGRRSLGAILTRLLDVADDAEFVQADAEHLTALARLAPGLVDGL